MHRADHRRQRLREMNLPETRTSPLSHGFVPRANVMTAARVRRFLQLREFHSLRYIMSSDWLTVATIRSRTRLLCVQIATESGISALPNRPFETDLRKRSSPARSAAQWRRYASPSLP